MDDEKGAIQCLEDTGSPLILELDDKRKEIMNEPSASHSSESDTA